jgi:hypothetical protein
MSADSKWSDPGQLIFYGLLLASIQRRYPTKLSFFLPLMPDIKDQLTEIEFTKHNFFRIYDRIKHLVSSWAAKDFPASVDSSYCYYCDVKAYCPSRASRVKN